MMNNILINDDVMKWAAGYTGPKFHALLCDPPYELGFMGKDWDRSGIAFNPETWEALAEHLLPGAFGMAFASSRGWHRLAVAIEDAGLIIHPSIFGWAYGSGFPKATRIDTQIDKAAGAEREPGIDPYAKNHPNPRGSTVGQLYGSDNNPTGPHSTPATDLARAWAGHRYGLQAMKPALEPIIVFQVPYKGKPVDSIVETGAGALNIDGARIGTNEVVAEQHAAYKGTQGIYGEYGTCLRHNGNGTSHPQGRWPANFYVDKEAARRLGEQSGELKSKWGKDAPQRRGSGGVINYAGDNRPSQQDYRGDTGTAARFFFNVNCRLDEADPVLYQAKASRKERDAGLEGMLRRFAPKGNYKGRDMDNPKNHLGGLQSSKMRNSHPCCKPIDLTRWFATLLLPPAEYAPRRILIPFAGSGSEMIGAHLAGWEEVMGVEMEKEYCEIAEARLKHWATQPEQLELI